MQNKIKIILKGKEHKIDKKQFKIALIKSIKGVFVDLDNGNQTKIN